MFKPLKYNRLKKVIDDKEERYVIEKDGFDPDTGQLSKTEEHMIDPTKLGERKNILQKEIDKIDNLGKQINKGNFDKTENKRTAKQ